MLIHTIRQTNPVITGLVAQPKTYVLEGTVSQDVAAPKPPVGSFREVLIRPVLIGILNYGMVAILDISFFALFTVFLAGEHQAFPPERAIY